MAFVNLLSGNSNTFDSGVLEWTITNGTAVRLLGLSPYSRFFAGDSAGTPGNIMAVSSDGVGVTSVMSAEFGTDPDDVFADDVFGFSAHVSSSLYTGLRDGFAAAFITWYDSADVEVASVDGPRVEIDLTNAADTAVSGARWYMISMFDRCPVGAVKGKATVEFSSTTLDAGTDADDLWALFDPVIVNVSTGVSAYADSTYGAMPEFMRQDDAANDSSNLPLQRFMSVLTERYSEVSDLAASFAHTRATDTINGVESKSALTDPDTIAAGAIPWLAALVGVSLSSGASNFTPWSAFTAASIDTWTEWEEDVVAGGATPDTTWAALEAYGLGFTDPVQTYRDQIRTGFSGIHAGRADTIVAFIRTLLNSEDPGSELVEIKKRDRGNPFLIEIDISNSVDPDPGSTLVETIVQSGLPAGVTANVESTTTPVAHSSDHRFFESDMLRLGAGIVGTPHAGGATEWKRQGFSNKEGGVSTLSLYNDLPNCDDTGLGGIIGEAPYVEGYALFSGYRVSAETATSAALAPVADFDIFVGVSNVVAPTDASGSGSEVLGTEGRIIASGNHWSLHMSKTEELSFVFDGTGSADTVTSTTTYPFAANSATGVVWIRVEKTDETVRFYAQRNLYDDWSDNQIGTDLALTGGNDTMNTAGASSYVKILEDDDPGTNPYDMSLSCIVHRAMLFTGSMGAGGWLPGALSLNDYSTAQLDINFNNDPVSVYDDVFTESSANSITITINDNGDTPTKMHVMLLSANGDTFYFGKSPDQFDAANGDNLGDTLSVGATGTALPSAAYDWRMTYVDTSDDTTLTDDVTTDTVTSIVWDADDYGDRCILSIEVIPTGGSFGGTEDVALFLPTTLDLSAGTTIDTAARIISATDGATDGGIKTWDLDRSHNITEEYLPSQLVDRDFVHTQDGVSCIHGVNSLDIHTEVSYAVVIRTDTIGDGIFAQLDASNAGIGGSILFGGVFASVTDGTITNSASYVHGTADRVGEWNLIVFRYSPINGISVNFNGVEQGQTTVTLVDRMGVADVINMGSVADTYDHALARFMVFDRYLSDAECLALSDEMGIV
jgi:hypothetical protein